MHIHTSSDVGPRNDLTVCDDLVTFFEDNAASARPGALGFEEVRPEAKLSHDLTISPTRLKEPAYAPFVRYMQLLQACYNDYTEQWPFLNRNIGRVHAGSFNVLKYDTGGYFADLHAERTSINHLHRVLAWMTYLNDVEADGETEFPHYDLKVKPRAGGTLNWPAEWTHAHRGLPVGAGCKYIIPGWFHFPED
jgi:prolyl 4-hydroxylase